MDWDKVTLELEGWVGTFGGDVPSPDDIQAAMRGELDPDTRTRMERYAGDVIWDREEVEEEALRLDPGTWRLDRFMALIGGCDVPTADAIVELKGGYDDWASLHIKYQRPETDEEMAVRVGRALNRVRTEQAKERATYKRLKAKFASVPDAESGLIAT
jgi:hypothetical protein